MCTPEIALLESRPYGHPAANVSEVVVEGHGIAATADSRLAACMVLAVLERSGVSRVEAD